MDDFHGWAGYYRQICEEQGKKSDWYSMFALATYDFFAGMLLAVILWAPPVPEYRSTRLADRPYWYQVLVSLFTLAMFVDLAAWFIVIVLL